MDTGNLPTIVTVLLILAIPAILVLIAYGLILLWRKRSRDAIILLGQQIQVHDTQLGEIHRFVDDYSRITQEPFVSRIGELQKEAGALQEQLERFLEASRAYENEVQGARVKELRDIIFAPVAWYRHWRRATALRKESSAISIASAATNEHIQQVYDLPWELAEQCRQADKDLADLTQYAQSLQNKGARGAALQAVLRQVPLIGQDLDKVPAVFYEADRETLLSSADTGTTVHVYEVLSRVRPALARYLPQVREWDSHYEKASAEFADLKQAGAALRQAIAAPPEGLDISGLQDRIDQIAQMASDISQRLAQPEAEELKSLSREITQLRKVIQDTEQQYGRASQQVGDLNKALEELDNGLERLSGQHGTLERSGTFPMVWDQSAPLVAGLRKRLEALGPARQPRTPEAVTQHLKEIENIRGGHQAHTTAYVKGVEQYRALVTLLESPELKEGAAWIRQTRDLLDEVASYEPRNWPKQDALQTLPDDLAALSAEQAQLVPADRTAAVKETELEQRLKNTQKLFADHKALRPRVDSIRARLDKIKAMETEGKDRLVEAYNALQRVAILTESNDLLFDTAGMEIERLSEEIHQAGNELTAQGQGEIEKKLQKINALADKTNRALNGWLAALNTAIAGQGKAISDRLAQLDTIGLLDEQPIVDAHALLKREEYISALNSPATPGAAGRIRDTVLQRSPQLGSLDATAEIKRKNDLWQTMLAVQHALEEKTGTLISAYQEMIAAKNEAHERITEMTSRIPTRRTWPPSNQTSLEEPQLTGPIDARWVAMKGMPRRIDAAILEVGRLTQQYRLATERVTQLLARVEQDEERIKDLEEEINDLKQRWQAQVQADPGNAVVREGVQHLISNADSRASFIHSQYIRGAISYEETLHNMRLMNDELFAARVPIDDKNDIGLNEKPRRSGTN